MKILFDCTELSYFNEKSGHRSGVFTVALNLYRQFVNMGLDITFICDYSRYYFMKDIKEFQNVPLLKENSFMNKIIGKVVYYSDKLPLKIKYAVKILVRYYDKYLYKTCNANLKQLENYDAYFSPFTPPSKEVQLSKIKKFRMLHDVIPIVENGMPKSPKDWHYKIYNSINDKDYYVTNSEYTRKDVLKYFPFVKETNIKTTLLAANKEFAPTQENSPIEGKYIFSLCTLGKRKNLEFLIENFFAFIKKNEIKDLKLVLGGSIWAKYEPELNRILDKYDHSKVILTGYIDEKQLAKYYSNALCFIYPSLYEGFGLPVLEAMQCGCPVITSNTTSLPEVIGDAGIQISPTDDNELILAYEKMYFDSEFRENSMRKGIDRAKQFSWEKCAAEITDFIKSSL